ncbi:MAG: HAD family acid phosphatase [Myxococcota bacterium]
MFVAIAAGGCAKPPPDDLMSLVWVQTAAEYDAAALATYHAAAGALDRALADPSWTAAVEQTGSFDALPPAIVVDADETVIDNSAYQARNHLDQRGFDPATWSAWVTAGEARAVPGAVAFLTSAHAAGVRVFYVSNRSAAQAEPTRANLAALGFPDTADLDTFRFRPAEGPGDKSTRRAAIAADHRIVLLIGDNLFDFVEVEAPAPPPDPAARDAMVEAHADWWGTRWFVVPNPLYGSWDDALVGYDHPAERVRHAARVGALDRRE